MSAGDAKVLKTEPLVSFQHRPFMSAIHNHMLIPGPSRKTKLPDGLNSSCSFPKPPVSIREANLSSTTYSDPLGKERTWEHAERKTRPKGSEIDGVGIVAILEKASGPEIILQKQYRPPIDKVVIEVPAGLVDAGESAEEAAVRELKEETGYVGVVSESSPAMFNGMIHP
jgi:hypothetical protein